MTRTLDSTCSFLTEEVVVQLDILSIDMIILPMSLVIIVYLRLNMCNSSNMINTDCGPILHVYDV